MKTFHFPRRLANGCSRVVLWFVLLTLPAVATATPPTAVPLESKPADSYFDDYSPVQAPKAEGLLLLRKGDRLAILGDSITQQKMYSRLIETYLTVCVPDLEISTRQFGRSGETAEGFRRRMVNDCLRFHPTVATLCYGMNDYRYRPYDEANARWYRENYTAIVQALKEQGARVILGSPGCVDQVAKWVKTASGTLKEHNQHLCRLRNIDIEIARQEHVRFADIFWTMFTAEFHARQLYGPDYMIAGKDGVHPGWAGHLVMAYVLLRAMGLDGDLGTITVDWDRQSCEATGGHRVDRFDSGALRITSDRYPFCASGDVADYNSLRSGMTLVPFNQDLNRLMLVVRNGSAPRYRITWGDTSRVYTADQLAKGINLAAEFAVNPFSKPFARVDQAVAAKQAFETQQINREFRSGRFRKNPDEVVAETEKERAELVDAIKRAFVPVTHTIRIAPEP